ncbi:hypothetical protein [Methylocaldum szegediense]|jgi:ABC-type transport system involved in cytochrome bd biosynthesis fused ATPase/permease subunit|uniref:Uncharacterized protein n=1 Tax=Methylocaldum szegediense TaxID=73780 RepID=A0ABM9I810_9GAMM|nr:hypothetical protein [Methylocaldum szegediense]CAI8948221.1 conserved protein of unknown function [Methylocaldum szegediense]
MFKPRLDVFLAFPIHASALVATFVILLFLPMVRPPITLSVLLVALLVYLSMFFGAKSAARENSRRLSLPDDDKPGVR